MGAFFVPISFLIFGYAASSRNLSWWNLCILSLASVSSYAAWLILYWRNNKANKIYIDRAKNIEEDIEKLGDEIKIKIKYSPLKETDDERNRIVDKWVGLTVRPLAYKFPESIWEIMLRVLVVLWILLIVLSGIN